MFIRLSTYLYGCRFCWDALDSAKKSRWHYGPSKLITAALAERIQTTPILYSVHDELCYVYIYIYMYLPVFFLPLSPIHPLFFCIYGVHAKFRHRLSASGLWQTSRPVRLGGRFGLGQRGLQPGSSHSQVRCDAQFGSLGRSLGFCW